jgi:hypothetical protein
VAAFDQSTFLVEMAVKSTNRVVQPVLMMPSKTNATAFFIIIPLLM